MNFAAVNHYAYIIRMFHRYNAELVNCSITKTFFHSSVRLASYRAVAVNGNDHNALWQFHYARTRSGLFLQQPRHTFRIMALLQMSELVLAVTKLPRREISCLVCFDIATTCSGCFF
jgi:hypothetical protein